MKFLERDYLWGRETWPGTHAPSTYFIVRLRLISRIMRALDRRIGLLNEAL